MFKSTAVLYSALSKRTKRVQVQLLKDFPRFHLYKGEVAKVKPSLMLNYLHYGNGARYILEESQVDQALLEYSKQQAEIRKAALAQEKKLQAEQAMDIEEETFELQKDIPKEDIEQKKDFWTLKSLLRMLIFRVCVCENDTPFIILSHLSILYRKAYNS